MKHPPLGPLLVVLALLLGGGVVAALATGGGGPDADPSPAAATKDVPGVVSLARPITPYASGRPATGRVELRLKHPKTGERFGVMFHRWDRRVKGRPVQMRCVTVAPEERLRTYPVNDGGSCRLEDEEAGQGVFLSTAVAPDGARLQGTVSRDVTRLTVAGPGGTFVVPRSPQGTFAVFYAAEVRGRAVLTATLKDGTTRYHRTALPPSFRPDGVAVAEDPGGLPDWFAGARLRDRGSRAGQTCLQVTQDTRPGKDGSQAGGAFLAPTCGDLRRGDVFAHTVELAPGPWRSQFSLGPRAPRRTILAGAVSERVRSLAVVTPSGRKELEIAPAGRAFLAVFPASVEPFDLLLEATLDDGAVQRFPNPRAVNRTTARNPTPTLRGRFTLEGLGDRRIRIGARLRGTPKRFEVTFLGREVRMDRVAGTDRYTGVYDGNRGVRRPVVAGRVYRFTSLICGDDCRVTEQRARLK